MKKTDLAWLAGIIDGEGCITLSNVTSRRYREIRPKIYVNNTNFDLIERVCQILSEIIGCKVKVQFRHRGLRWRAVYCITFQGKRRCNLVLSAILPYLVAKRKQAQILLEFTSRPTSGRGAQYTPDEIDMVGKIHSLNQRGIAQPALDKF